MKGAHEGQGLGNAFLSNIAACDAIFHLTRLPAVLACPSRFHLALGAFDDDDIIHVEGDVNPVRDLDIIHNELRLKVRFLVMMFFKSPHFPNKGSRSSQSNCGWSTLIENCDYITS